MMDFSFNLAEDQATQPAVAGSLEEPPRPRRTAAPRRAPRVDEPGRAARAGVWIRKILGFPIGERFAAISITAALFDARATFVVLLVLGTYATVHRGVGRIRISLGRRGRGRAVLAPRSDPGQSHAALRDDGPLARMLGRLGGGRPAIPPIAIVTAGGLPLLAAAAIGGDDVAWGIAAAVVGWAILLGGLSSGRPLGDRMRWAVPPSVRLIEYGGVLWLAALAGASALPAAFALLCAITFRHYDAFYRSRQRGDPPPPWVADAAGGWTVASSSSWRWPPPERDPPGCMPRPRCSGPCSWARTSRAGSRTADRPSDGPASGARLVPMPRIELPDGRYFSCAYRVDAEAGGQTRALLARSRILAQEGGVRPDVLMLGAEPEVSERRAALREHGLLADGGHCSTSTSTTAITAGATRSRRASSRI